MGKIKAISTSKIKKITAIKKIEGKRGFVMKIWGQIHIQREKTFLDQNLFL